MIQIVITNGGDFFSRSRCTESPAGARRRSFRRRPGRCGVLDGDAIYTLDGYYLSAYARQPARGPCWGDRGERLGAIWAHLGAMLAYLGPSWGYVGLSWGQFGPILGLCWPILTHLRARLAHLGAMLVHLDTYVGPCWPILSHKLRKMGKIGTAKNTVKRGTF